MSLDFAIKDFYRKREITMPFIVVITLIISLSVFIVNFTTSLGLNSLVTYNFSNRYYFSGGISIVFSDFTTIIISLVLVLAVIVVIVVTSTLIITKKRDIAIMKALGILPPKLYNLFLTEAYLIFFIGFISGVVIGLISFGIFYLISGLLGVSLAFYLDFIYIPLMFISCLAGIYFVPGVILKKIGSRSIISSFSKDIPYNYDSSKGLRFIPKWLSKIGYNFKISVVNTIRRKGEFKRYMAVFSIISLIIFTLALGTVVLNSSSREWINKAQSTNIIAIGHQDVLENYALMYNMFSNPEIIISNNSIDFLDPQYLFNFSDINAISSITEIKTIDKRIVGFFNVEEESGYYCNISGGCQLVGQGRKACLPLVGMNKSDMIQDFEIEGDYYTYPDDQMIIGDGMAYNMFDYPFSQPIWVEEINHQFHITGIVIDTFYSGFAGYIDLSFLQSELGYNPDQINLLLLKIDQGSFNDISTTLESLIQNLGGEFSFISLESTFKNNLDFINNLTLYPFFLILIMSIVSIISLYNFQKGGIMDKAKDFLIMRALGTKFKSIRKVLFMEAFYVIVPSLSLSLGIGMILNSIFLFQRVFLPPLSIPLLVMGAIFMMFLIFNYLSLFPILKKIKSFTIKDFDIY